MTRKTRTTAAAADPKLVLADLQRTLVGRLGPDPAGRALKRDEEGDEGDDPGEA